jgi:UDP-2,3-diacylglucosamine pyrophosphatase LpxH
MTEDMEPKNKDRPVILAGDTHGDFTALHRYLKQGVLDDSLLIQVGDFMGFDAKVWDGDKSKSKMFRSLEILNKSLQAHNCFLEAIRGNHENPDWWSDSKMNQDFNQTFSNITLLPDYYSKTINGKKILFLGGGVSVDRHVRVPNVSYWKEEEVSEPRFTLTEHDILISHTCPSYFNFGPKNKESLLMRWAHANDPELEDDLVREREIMDHVVQVTQVKNIYGGHFHHTSKEEKNGVKYQCLDIDELQELTFDE